MKLNRVFVLRMIKGFSLIEVLVFVTILSLVFVSVASVTTYILRATKFNEDKILATHFSEEGLEWIKSEKELDWNRFTSLDSSGGTGTTYCITTLDWLNPGICNGTYFLGTPNIFSREVVLTNQGGSPVNQTDVQVKVYWREINNIFSITTKSTQKILE